MLEVLELTKREERVHNEMWEKLHELGISASITEKNYKSEDEFEAWCCIMRNVPVPEELKERILANRKFYKSLGSILFEEIGESSWVNEFMEVAPVKSRDYLKMQEGEEERLKQLQEKFLNCWDAEYSERVKMIQQIGHRMMSQYIISVKDGITLDDIERFIYKIEHNENFR